MRCCREAFETRASMGFSKILSLPSTKPRQFCPTCSHLGDYHCSWGLRMQWRSRGREVREGRPAPAPALKSAGVQNTGTNSGPIPGPRLLPSKTDHLLTRTSRKRGAVTGDCARTTGTGPPHSSIPPASPLRGRPRSLASSPATWQDPLERKPPPPANHNLKGWEGLLKKAPNDRFGIPGAGAATQPRSSSSSAVMGDGDVASSRLSYLPWPAEGGF